MSMNRTVFKINIIYITKLLIWVYTALEEKERWHWSVGRGGRPIAATEEEEGGGGGGRGWRR